MRQSNHKVSVLNHNYFISGRRNYRQVYLWPSWGSLPAWVGWGAPKYANVFTFHLDQPLSSSCPVPQVYCVPETQKLLLFQIKQQEGSS